MTSTNKNVSVNLRENKMDTTSFNISDSNNVSISVHSTGANMAASTNARTRINNCLPCISTFVGREDELKKLTQLVQEHHVVALVGMGGLGKTQLARKFITVNTDKYTNCLYWLGAETVDNLRTSFLQLASELDVPVKINGMERDANAILKEVYTRFSEGLSLLVFDNIEKRDDIYPYLPTTLGVQERINVHILITSRRKNWIQNKIPTLPLDTLPWPVAMKLFEEIFGEEYGKTSVDEWKNLAELLGYLPLALQVAASYIKYFGVSVSQYIEKLKKDTHDLLVDPLPEYDNRSIYISMMMTLELLEKRNDRKYKLAVTVINAAAYMNPECIRKRLLLSIMHKDDNEFLLDEALNILTEFSLFKDWIDEYTVHRIIQTSIRHQQTEKNTADIYYIEALKYDEGSNKYLLTNDIPLSMLFSDFRNTYILQYAAERASAIVDYYNQYPTSSLIRRLVEGNFIVALEAVSEKIKNNQFQSLIEQYNLLYLAVERKHLRMVQLLLDKGADFNLLHRKTGKTPLHCACNNSSKDIVKWLMQNKASTTIRDRYGYTALHRAAKKALHVIVSTITEIDKAAVNLTDDLGNTPLLAIDYCNNKEFKGILPTIQVLFDHGADITKANKWGSTVLHLAARSVCAAAVSLILKLNKGLINIEDMKNRTALHVISHRGRIANVEQIRSTLNVLIKNGADLTKVSQRGRIVLHSAAGRALANVVEVILEQNKDLINIEDEDGETALHALFHYDSYIYEDEVINSTIRVLVKNGADLEKVDKQGRSILHLAAGREFFAAVSLILELNKDLVYIVNNKGQTAFHVVSKSVLYLLCEDKFKEIAQLLIQHGLSVYTADKQGRTPLETVFPSYKNILQQVADECKDRPMVEPAKRTGTE